jgi:hypothetical protein
VELEDPLAYSQEPAAGPYPEPDESSTHPQTMFSDVNFNIILPAAPSSLKWFLPSGFPGKFGIHYSCPLNVLHIQPTSSFRTVHFLTPYTVQLLLQTCILQVLSSNLGQDSGYTY